MIAIYLLSYKGNCEIELGVRNERATVPTHKKNKVHWIVKIDGTEKERLKNNIKFYDVTTLYTLHYPKDDVCLRLTWMSLPGTPRVEVSHLELSGPVPIGNITCQSNSEA